MRSPQKESNRMNNIIECPWLKKLNPPQSLTDIECNLKNVRSVYIQKLVTNISEDLFDALYAAGFDVDSEDSESHVKDLAIIAESIRSYLLRSVGDYHPMQDVAENMFEWIGDGMLKTVDEINIKFNDPIHDVTV